MKKILNFFQPTFELIVKVFKYLTTDKIVKVKDLSLKSITGEVIVKKSSFTFVLQNKSKNEITVDWDSFYFIEKINKDGSFEYLDGHVINSKRSSGKEIIKPKEVVERQLDSSYFFTLQDFRFDKFEKKGKELVMNLLVREGEYNKTYSFPIFN